MNNYLVGVADSKFEEQQFCVIEADYAEEAELVFVREFVITEEGFLEYVYERAMNMSFAENFWFQTPEEHQLLHNEGRSNIDDDEFKTRVRDYFAPHEDFANIYLEYYFDQGEEEPNGYERFPEGMLIYIWTNSDWSDVMSIELSTLKR